MRQMVYERPFFYPQRFLHVCKPGFINWNVEPHLAGSGLLGVAPFFDVARQVPRQAYHPQAVPAHSNVQTYQTLEPFSSERIIVQQMTWLKGTKRYRSRKKKVFSKAGCTKRKLVKKEVSRKDASIQNALPEKDVATISLLERSERLHSAEQDEMSCLKEVADGEHLACGREVHAEVMVDDVEEGEIISDSPKRNHGVDTNVALCTSIEVTASNSPTDHHVEKSIVDLPLVESDSLVQKLFADDNEEKQFANKKDCGKFDSSCDKLSLETVSRDSEVDVVGSSNFKANESGLKNKFQLDGVYSKGQMITEPSDGPMPLQFLEAPNADVFSGACEGTSDTEMSTKPSTPSLAKTPTIVKPLENDGKGCLNSRDPRRRHEMAGSLDQVRLIDMAPGKQSIGRKRKPILVSLPDSPSKRFCIGEESACQSMAKNQLSNEVVVQEPIDMDIDDSDLSVIPRNIVNTPNIIYYDDVNHPQAGSTSEPFTIIDSLKPGLRSRDPRIVLLHQSDSDGGLFLTGHANSCSSNKSEVKEKTPCDLGKKQKCSNLNVSRILKDPWENMHCEELTDKEREAIHVERARRIDEQNHLLNSKKLCLVLDLDHTLLNSVKFSDLDENMKKVLCGMETRGRRSTNGEKMKKDLFRYPELGMWTKLRPGVHDFLSRASELYELHVYTMGNKAYASQMTKLLDPTGTLFAGRVISRGDDNEGTFNNAAVPKSKDLDGVLGLESAVIIIDDSIHVWPHHRHNLLVVERYMYFPSSRRQFGLSGPSLLEIRHDERVVDGMLGSILKVIENVHHNFFSNERLHEMDVRHVLMAVKRTVLAGCKIVFSRVYPQGEAQPHLHPLWQTAEQFGAVCTTTIEDDVTHVVAISRGTDKVKWAMRTGRFLVRPSWLEASAVLYRRANEAEFSVPP